MDMKSFAFITFSSFNHLNQLEGATTLDIMTPSIMTDQNSKIMRHSVYRNSMLMLSVVLIYEFCSTFRLNVYAGCCYENVIYAECHK